MWYTYGMDTKEFVGEQLKKARRQKGLTQTELANKLNCSEMMVSRYEVGLNNIPTKKLEKIAKILNKSVSYFFGEEDSVITGQKIWEKAQSEIKQGRYNMPAPRLMLAFSLPEGISAQKKKLAEKEAEQIMKKWYKDNKMHKHTRKSFTNWWNGK